MLIEFFGRNFGSFRDEFRLSMLASDIDPGDDRGIVEVKLEGEDEPLRLLRCVAIYGANASGKSTVLQAADALNWLLSSSASLRSDELLRKKYEPFRLDQETARGLVMLGLRAVIGRRVYEYAVEFDGVHIEAEKLNEITAHETRALFERSGQTVTGPWCEHEQFELLAKSFRPNALLLSLADTLVPLLAQDLAAGFRRLLTHYDISRSALSAHVAARRVLEGVSEDSDFEVRLIDWLAAADFGIVDVKAKEVEEERSLHSPGKETRKIVRTVYRLEFLHIGSGGQVGLDYARESMGTRKVVELAPFLYDLVHGQDVHAYFIDEVGASIHPQLLRALIGGFNCETKPESVRGQLIFATHETILLDAEAKDAVLRRDQIYLTEKDSSGCSRLYSVAEFKERNNLNLRRRYLQGRYGALPSLDRFGD